MSPKGKVKIVKFAGQGRNPLIPFSAQAQGLILVRRNDANRWENVIERVQQILQPGRAQPEAVIVQTPSNRRFQSNATKFVPKLDPWIRKE